MRSRRTGRAQPALAQHLSSCQTYEGYSAAEFKDASLVDHVCREWPRTEASANRSIVLVTKGVFSAVLADVVVRKLLGSFGSPDPLQ